MNLNKKIIFFESIENILTCDIYWFKIKMDSIVRMIPPNCEALIHRDVYPLTHFITNGR